METTVQPFDFDDLPDFLSQAEALWILTGLSYALALCGAYRQILNDPKPWADADKAAKALEHLARRQYGPGEAEFMIALAHRKAAEGVDAQKTMMQEAPCSDPA